jgi:hypothetical protein
MHMLGRDDRLAVTGVRRSAEVRAAAVFVARRLPDGTVRSAGAIELGLRREIVQEIDEPVADLPPIVAAPSSGIRPRCP